MRNQGPDMIRIVLPAAREALAAATASSRRFLEGEADAPERDAAVTQLKRVQVLCGLLSLAEAARLCATLAERLQELDDPTEDSGLAEQLLHGLLVLPRYLDWSTHGRQASWDAYLSSMAAQLGGGPGVGHPPHGAPADLAARRARFQRGLVGLMRKRDRSDCCAVLDQVLGRLAADTGNHAGRLLWSRGRWLVRGLSTGQIPVDSIALGLLGGLDRQMRQLVESGPHGLSATPARALSQRIQEHCQSYSLVDPSQRPAAMPTGSDAPPPDPDTMKSVLRFLREELAVTQDAVERFSVGTDHRVGALEAVPEGLLRARAVLQVLGFLLPARMLFEHVERLRTLERTNEELSAGHLAELTRDIAVVADCLHGSSPPDFLREAGDGSFADRFLEWYRGQARRAALGRCAAELATVRQQLEQDSREARALSSWNDLAAQLSRVVRVSDLAGFEGTELLATLADRMAGAGVSMPEDGFMARSVDFATVLMGLEMALRSASGEACEAAEPLQSARLALGAMDRGSGIGEPVAVGTELPSETPAGSAFRETFDQEARQQLDRLTALLPLWREQLLDPEILEPAGSCFQTLKGRGSLVGNEPIVAAAGALQELVEDLLAGLLKADAELAELLEAGALCCRFLLDAEDEEAAAAEARALTDRLVSWRLAATGQAAPEQAVEPPTEPAAQAPVTPAGDEMAETILAVFLEEAEGELGRLRGLLTDWAENPPDTAAIAEVRRAFHTIKGSASTVGAVSVGELAWRLEDLLNRLMDGRRELDADLTEVLVAAPDALDLLLTAAATGDLEARLPPLAERAEALLSGAVAAAPAAAGFDEQLRRLAGHPAWTQGSTAGPEPAGATGGEKAATGDSEAAADRALIEVFVREAADILDSSDSLVDRWRQEPDNPDVLADLRREMHTLKGGSRMAGFLQIGDLAHAVESLLDAVARRRLEFRPEVADTLQRALDRCQQMIDSVRDFRQPAPAADMIGVLETVLTTREAKAFPVPAEPAASSEGAEAELPGAAQGPMADDTVRVNSRLLDRLVKQIGESSIFRSRIEREIGGFRFNLGELELVIDRLADRLRSLEIETEAQIRFRYERAPDLGSPEFDPLELDRFSELQQLSRSLVETAHDLASVRNVLDSQVRDVEGLLEGQSQVGRSLQQDLITARLVPFSSVMPRLRRLVRQTGEELGKRVELVCHGTRDLERSLLERLLGPLEHVLRNAIFHGIESPADRLAKGKPETGRVELLLRREGSELLLSVADDGAGVDLQRVRERAEAAGILQPDAEPTSQQLFDLLLESGFTTTEQVTHVAGRGVGLDVVRDTVRDLGGSIQILAEPDVGARFIMRFPYSLDIVQCLLVEAGGSTYAVPMVGIAGVARLEPKLLQRYLSGRESELDYDGNRYELHSLGALLNGRLPSRTEAQQVMPGLLVSSGMFRVVLQVDRVLASEELIVKPVGPQVNSVPGMSGASVLSDGRVVLILEMGAVVRNYVARQSRRELEALRTMQEGLPEKPLSVMVIDDSITMRKFTERLLTRYGVAVSLAKDGMDAVSKLEQRVPDAVILDIEMPRMDGYELAAHMRNQDELKEVPIIMVTSRSGPKHRQRALELGVSVYLGKPYQEQELIGALQRVLGVNADRLRARV